MCLLAINIMVVDSLLEFLVCQSCNEVQSHAQCHPRATFLMSARQIMGDRRGKYKWKGRFGEGEEARGG